MGSVAVCGVYRKGNTGVEKKDLARRRLLLSDASGGWAFSRHGGQ